MLLSVTGQQHVHWESCVEHVALPIILQSCSFWHLQIARLSILCSLAVAPKHAGVSLPLSQAGQSAIQQAT